MSLFERIKNIRRSNLQEKKIKFPGGTGDIGFNAPKRREKVQKRLTRADDVYGTPDPFDPDYDKKVKKVDGRTKVGKVFKSTKPVTTSAPGFGKGDTPGQTRVKGLEKKAFKKTQPKDIKLPQSFKDFSTKLRRLKSDVQDFKDKDIATMRTGKSSSKLKVSGGKNLSRQDVGMAPPDKPTKSATEYTKQINQANKNRKEFTGIKKTSKNTMPSGKDFITKYKKQAETATTNLRKKVDTIAKNPKLTGSQKAAQSRPVMKNVKIAQNFARGYKNNPTSAVVRSKDLDMVKSAAKSPITKPKVSLPNIPKEVRVGTSGRVKTKGPQLLDDITVKNKPREVIFAKTSSKVLAKTPKAIKPIARPALKLLAKAGTPGRIAAAGLGVAAISPAGRKALGQLATGTGLTALFGRRKKDKALKVGDGLTKVSNMPSKYQPKGMKSGTFKEPGSNKVRGTGDVRVRFDLASGGGRVRNPKDVARVKNIQKNYIDDYNKKAAKNPLKKQIKYSVNKDGSYTVTPPKKK